jgi:hypothetical protein
VLVAQAVAPLVPELKMPGVDGEFAMTLNTVPGAMVNVQIVGEVVVEPVQRNPTGWMETLPEKGPFISIVSVAASTGP